MSDEGATGSVRGAVVLVVQITAAMGIIIYVSGWVFLRTFFESFRAGWLISLVPLDSLPFSGAPIYFVVGPLLLLLLLGFTPSVKYERRLQIIAYPTGAVILTLLSATGTLLLRQAYQRHPSQVFSIIGVLALTFGAEAMLLAVIQLRKRTVPTRQFVGWVFGSITAVAVVTPICFGYSVGIAQSDPRTTTLPLVITNSEPLDSLRAVYSDEYRIYCVDMDSLPRVIEPIAWSSVRCVASGGGMTALSSSPERMIDGDPR